MNRREPAPCLLTDLYELTMTPAYWKSVRTAPGTFAYRPCGLEGAPMDIADLIEALSDPAAYPHPVDRVEVRQTHISVVFLAGPYVYKVKKPVNPGFLDFTTLGKRRHFCDEEVRLNRRLAPDVYLGVVPVARGFRFEGEGEVVEWAVKMRRLPDDATVLERLRRDEADVSLAETLARRVALFHRNAESCGPAGDCC